MNSFAYDEKVYKYCYSTHSRWHLDDIQLRIVDEEVKVRGRSTVASHARRSMPFSVRVNRTSYFTRCMAVDMGNWITILSYLLRLHGTKCVRSREETPIIPPVVLGIASLRCFPASRRDCLQSLDAD